MSNNEMKAQFNIFIEDLVGNLFYTLKSNNIDVNEISYNLIEKYKCILADNFIKNNIHYRFNLSRDDTYQFLINNSKYYEESEDEKNIVLVHDYDASFFANRYQGYLSLEVLKTILDNEVIDKTIKAYKGSKMIINYSDQEVIKGKKSIFLAGPTPRDKNIKSWRKDACKFLEENGFDGVVYVPEFSNWKPLENYNDQTEWEREGLSNASVILFWIPRQLPDMPAFTTNVEFGYWLHSGKIIYGRPDDSRKNKYLDWLYGVDTGLEPIKNLNELLLESIKKANEIGVVEQNEVLPLEKRKILK